MSAQVPEVLWKRDQLWLTAERTVGRHFTSFPFAEQRNTAIG